MIHDLHTHSSASDGHLSPVELLCHAREHGVDVLSITDHDTVAAYAQLATNAMHDLHLVPGIELSTSWERRSIHVVGLDIDPCNPALLDGIAQQQRARTRRARRIGQRLTRLGIDDPYPAVVEIAGDATVGRPHFAQHLVDIGRVKDTQTAFRKFLGAGKLGDVRQGWASMADVIAWIRAAGGIAVLAHPLKYRFTMTKLGALLNDFRDQGGEALEVVCGQQEINQTRRLARFANDLGLLASRGSDFHHPANRWSRPGGMSPMPDNVQPVWSKWQER